MGEYVEVGKTESTEKTLDLKIVKITKGTQRHFVKNKNPTMKKEQQLMRLIKNAKKPRRRTVSAAERRLRA